jgi:hypothetical protein
MGHSHQVSLSSFCCTAVGPAECEGGGPGHPFCFVFSPSICGEWKQEDQDLSTRTHLGRKEICDVMEDVHKQVGGPSLLSATKASQETIPKLSLVLLVSSLCTL